MTGMNTSQLIAYLNAINTGDIDSIEGKLDQARQACLQLEQSDLADKLHEAVTALRQADLRTYRRRIATVVARLGHVR